ncbi:MAG TPA: dihydrodipicolinate synthase family protein [Acidobacteriaceae bacterium]
MNDHAVRPYRGVFPVVPTIFDDRGGLDLEGQNRCVDFMLDAGSDGLAILANFSEQFTLADDEREILTASILKHVAGRVPVIVTTTHFSTAVCADRSRRAQDLGAAMVMVMPPYHGATIRVSPAGIQEFMQRLSDAISIPIMIQDAPVAGTPLPAAFLAQMARDIEHVAYFKIETPQAAAKLREIIALGGESVEGPWDGEEAITLLADLDAGATGSMTGGGYPDLIKPIVDSYLAGHRASAMEHYARCLPLINYENRQCGLLAAKILMKEGGIIQSDHGRHPLAPVHQASRAGLIEIAASLNAMVLSWGK